MFKMLQKKYNFYKGDNHKCLQIPKLRLDTAQNIVINKKKSILRMLNLNKITTNKPIITEK